MTPELHELVSPEANDRMIADEEARDLAAERASVQPWLVSDDDAERLLRRKVRDLFADAYKNAA